MSRTYDPCETVVVTGIGMVTSVGGDRESTWNALRLGQSGVGHLRGLPGIPDDLLIGAPVATVAGLHRRLKVMRLAERAAAEALADARIDTRITDPARIGCALSAHMGDTGWLEQHWGFAPPIAADEFDWNQWLPNSACVHVAHRFGLHGPRLCHSTACASGLMEVLAAVRAIQDGQCDVAVAGSAEAFHPLFVAGFRQLRVLAHHEDPRRASRPFDRARNGFVMGEGGAMLVVERLDHALGRGATIYAELCGGTRLAEAHHETGLDAESRALTQLIRAALRRAELEPDQIGYISAHATGTRQNDVVEARGIRQGLGSAADQVCIGANKSALGHLVNAAGSVELAIALLALRDGFAPPTLNLEDPDPECALDCVPLIGRTHRVDTALKISCAFGGHLAAIAVRRWNDRGTGFGYPGETSPARRTARAA